MATQTPVRSLYLAFDLGADKWLLAFGTEAAEKPRIRSMPARNIAVLLAEIVKAKARFGLPEDARVFSCYEAGRDAFWLHRCLSDKGILNLVIDSASIAVNRRSKQAKSDSIDAGELLTMLIRYYQGERKVWSVVNVPSVAEEDQRQLHRNLKDLKWHRTECGNRIGGLLAALGLTTVVDATFRERLAKLQDWQGQAVPAGMRDRLLREFALWELAHRQIRDLENEQERLPREGTEPFLEKIRRLIGLKAIGVRSAWVFVQEIFAWRQIKNGKELAALTGLTPTPYASGKSDREQGISKAGNRHVRGMMVEIAWLWLRWQPQSHLSQWYPRRFGLGNSRSRKVGIVALARKLLIALWRYVDQGTLPEGAHEKDWRLRVDSTARRHARAGAESA